MIFVGTLKHVTLSNSRAEARHSAVAWFRNRPRQAGTPVAVNEQISVSFGWRLGTNNFHMIAVKRAVWRWIGNQRGFQTSLNFPLLTVVKSTFSRNNFAVYIGPDQETRGLDARVPTRVQVVKDGSTHCQMHQTTRTHLVYIAKYSLSWARNGNLFQLQGSGRGARPCRSPSWSWASARASGSIADCLIQRIKLRTSASATQVAWHVGREF